MSTKIHLACEQSRKPLSLLLTAGHAGDSPQMIRVPEAIRVPRLRRGHPRSHPERVLADKASSSAANRRYLRRRRTPTTIAIPKDQIAHHRARDATGGRPPAFTPTLYQRRHAVEYGINPAQTPPRRRQPLRL